MAQRASLTVLLVSMMLACGLSGCLGDEALDFLPEKKGVPGGLTLACLRSTMYTSMVIEIDHEPGYRPFTSSTEMLVERLEQVCDKPSGISIEYSEVSFEHEGTWSAQDVRDKGWSTKDQSPRDGTTLYWQCCSLQAPTKPIPFSAWPLMPRPWRCSAIPSMKQRGPSDDPP